MRFQPINPVSFQALPFKYAEVSKNLSRSAQPKPEDLISLKEEGITDIINLRTMTDTSCLFDEGAEAKKLGMRYHNIAINHRKPTEQNIVDFLNVMTDAEKNNRKVLVHCLEGKDRTGLCVFVYKMLKGIGTLAQNKAEWLSFGHDFVKYPNMMGWADGLVQKFKANKMFFK
jgi:protein tyrosine phosphatase (PTP) superfamily phosphohydrolase (DUF442 family)